MIVIMKPTCSDEELQSVLKMVEEMGSDHCVLSGSGQKMVEVLGAQEQIDRERLTTAPMVDQVLDRVGAVLATARAKDGATREVPLGKQASIGGRKLAVIAGPCSVESEGQLREVAFAVREAGAVGLRGGAFKPRTSPYSFQGHGEHGLEMMARAAAETGLAVVTEVMSPDQVDLVARYADMLQIGSRSMQNFPLLEAVGRQQTPVLIKRGWSATLEEMLMAAEYVMRQGNCNVVLCERGIRTHERFVRNTLSLAVVPEVHRISSLPIIVDPSHGTGRRHLVSAMSQAAIACGADGLLVEVHPDPDHAWSDRDQTLSDAEFRDMMRRLSALAPACDREV